MGKHSLLGAFNAQMDRQGTQKPVMRKDPPYADIVLSSSFKENLTYAHYANGYWAVTGNYGKVFFSNKIDSPSWKSVTLTYDSEGSKSQLTSVYYGAGYWLVCGKQYIWYTRTLSESESDWTRVELMDSNLMKVYWASDKWIAVDYSGKLWYKDSTSGSPSGSWNYKEFPKGDEGFYSLTDIYYANNYWAVTANEGIVYYTDDFTKTSNQWSSKPLNDSALTSIRYGNGYWVAGDSGENDSGSNGTIYYTADLATDWTVISPPITKQRITSVAFVDGIGWLASDNGANGRSADPAVLRGGFIATSGLNPNSGWYYNTLFQGDDISFVYYANNYAVWIDSAGIFHAIRV